MSNSKDADCREQSRQGFMQIGAYLLAWGQLETRISWSISEIAPHAVGPHVSEKNIQRALQAILDKWLTVYCETTAKQIPQAKAAKEAISEASRDRNNICHGLSGLWLDPTSYGLVCFSQFHFHKMTGKSIKQKYYGRDELVEMCNELVRFEREVNRLTSVAIASPRKPKATRAPS